MEKTSKETKLIIVIFLFTVFSGALRKWVIPTKAFGNIILLLQLIIPFVFLLSQSRILPFNNRMFALFFLYLAVCIFNPLNLTIYHGLLGLLIHGGLWYMLFFYIENRSKINLVPLIPLFIIICGLEIGLGFLQYQLPPDNILNKYADLEAVGGSIANVGDAVRVCGTFSYIGGYGSFLLFYTFFIWALVKINYNAFITVTLLFLGLISCFMSGSRSSTYLYLIFFFFIVLTEFKKAHFQNLFRGLALPIIFIFLTFLIKGTLGFGDKFLLAFNNFNERRIDNKNSGEEQQRIFWDIQQLMDFHGRFPVFGVGLGATYQGATATFGTSDYVKEAGYLETENTRIVVEGGFVLLFLKLAISVFAILQLSVSKKGKFFLVFFFFFLVNYVYNIYSSIFLFLGLALIDNVYYWQKIKKLQDIAPPKQLFALEN